MIRRVTLFLILFACPFVVAAPTSVSGLVAALNSQDASQRTGAVARLQALGRSDPLVGEVIATLAAQLKSREPLFQVWQDRRPADPAMRPYVVAITQALDDPVADNRVTAARSLGDFFDPVAVPALIDGLDDEDPEMREWLVRVLSIYDESRSVSPLMDRLGDSNAVVRGWTARALLAMSAR